MKTMRLLMAALAAVLLATATEAATYYVDVSWTGTESGTQTEPFQTLDAAITAANAGTGPHSIYIAEGVYADVANSGLEDFSAGGGVDGGYNLAQRINFYGGYAGWDGATGFDWTEASRVPRSTIIDLTDASSRAFYRPTSGQAGAVLFNGLTFRNANHTHAGGAIWTPSQYNQGNTIVNCLFTNNVTTGDGGAVFLGNQALSQVTDSEFYDNQGANGGALYWHLNYTHDWLIGNCTFSNNTATVAAGAVFINTSYTKWIRDSRFIDNSAGSHGGGVFASSGRTEIDGCVFIGNSAGDTARGGAAVGGDAGHHTGSFTLINTLVQGNTGGYAVDMSGANVSGGYTIDMRHCTVVGNTGGVRSRHHNGTTGILRIRNSIIANNDAYGITRPELNDPEPILEYNNVTNNTSGDYHQCTAGTGSISADPQFLDAGSGDYRLAKGSPCIDAGTDAGVTADFDGVMRPTRAGFDIGAFEEWQVPVMEYHQPFLKSGEAKVRAELAYAPDAYDTHAFIVLDTTDQGTNSMSGWWKQSGDLGIQDEGVIFAGPWFDGLSTETTYTYRVVASNDYDVAWGPVMTLTTPPTGTTRTWTGLGADNLASTAQNWSGDTLPTWSDTVVLDSTTNKNMTWDYDGANGLPNGVGAWTQTADYTGTVMFNTTYASFSETFTLFTVVGNAIIEGGSWTHIGPQNHADQRYRLNVDVGGNLTVTAPGTITAFGKGYNNQQGPGGYQYQIRGSSHGGQGGSLSATRGTVYGSIRSPVTLGSGGSTGGSNNGHGGGSIELAVGGAAIINGVINADAFFPTSGPASGAGGSVWLRAGSLSGIGSGRLSADGHQMGGGGRVAVILDDAAVIDNVILRAEGGTHTIASGAAGTVYIETTSHDAGKGILRLDNADKGSTVLGGDPHLGNAATRMPATGNGGPVNLADFAEIIVTGKAILGLASDTVWNPATTPLTVNGRANSWVGLTDSANAVVWPATFSIDGFSLVLDSPLSVTGDWTVTGDGRITRFRGRNVSYSVNERLVLNLTGNLTVASGGEIHTDYQGFQNGQGSAAGAWSPGRGGGHGGQGGFTTATPGLTYGSIFAPLTWGSGGSSGGNNTAEGGGAMDLTISGLLTVNGLLRAAAFPNGNSGGAGGSISVQAGSLAGSGGVIQARGHNSGAGGRVAVRLNSGTSFPAGVAIDSRGGTISSWWGASGTVYTETAEQAGGKGHILVENGHWPSMPGSWYGVQLPPSTGAFDDDLVNATLELASRARVRLLGSHELATLVIDGTSILDLNGHTLTLKGATVDGAAVSSGEQSAASLGLAQVIDSAGTDGRIIIPPPGTLFLMR